MSEDKTIRTWTFFFWKTQEWLTLFRVEERALDLKNHPHSCQRSADLGSRRFQNRQRVPDCVVGREALHRRRVPLPLEEEYECDLAHLRVVDLVEYRACEKPCLRKEVATVSDSGLCCVSLQCPVYRENQCQSGVPPCGCVPTSVSYLVAIASSNTDEV